MSLFFYCTVFVRLLYFKSSIFYTLEVLLTMFTSETYTNRSHFNYKWENGNIVEVNALFSDLWYDKEVKLFMEKQN